jgi:hypothetical protein
MRPKSTPAIPSLIRELNERSVLDILRTHGALHAAQIARHIGFDVNEHIDLIIISLTRQSGMSMRLIFICLAR